MTLSFSFSSKKQKQGWLVDRLDCEKWVKIDPGLVFFGRKSRWQAVCYVCSHGFVEKVEVKARIGMNGRAELDNNIKIFLPLPSLSLSLELLLPSPTS